MRREDPETLLRDVGRRVAELRREKGQTQQEFAAVLGVSVRYVARIEAGRQNLTVHRLAWLANALGVRVRTLMARPAARGTRRPGRPRTRA